MPNRIRCDVQNWDETRRALGAIDALLPDSSLSGGAGIDETPWVAYTPDVQNAAGTSFVGSATVDGHWRRWGSTVEVRVYLVPAIDTGTVPGSANQWYITLPVNTIDTKAIVGPAFGYAKDADPTSASALQAIGSCRVPASDPGRMQAYFNRDGFTHWLSGANPFDTAGLPSDQMYYELTIVYPIAER